MAAPPAKRGGASAFPSSTYRGLGLTRDQEADAGEFRLSRTVMVELRKAAQMEGLPPAAWWQLVNTVLQLKDYELNERPRLSTDTQLVAQLENVERSALALSQFIDAMGVRGRIFFSDALFRLGGSPAELDGTEDPARDVRYAVAAQRSASLSMAAARTAVAERRAQGIRPGTRAETLPSHAEQLAILRVLLVRRGANLQRKGSFRRLCEAAFKAAGVHAGAAGALSYVKKHFRTHLTQRDLPHNDACFQQSCGRFSQP